MEAPDLLNIAQFPEGGFMVAGVIGLVSSEIVYVCADINITQPLC